MTTLRQRVTEFERVIILDTLRETKYSYKRAAKLLGVDRSNFYRLLKQHGITRPATMERPGDAAQDTE